MSRIKFYNDVEKEWLEIAIFLELVQIGTNRGCITD